MKFMKWHGAGNDFILMNAADWDEEMSVDLTALARQVCHRQFGIGADGLMVVFPSSIADFKMVYYNSDGSHAAMCGNGIRCFSAFCLETGLTASLEFSVETDDGVKQIQANREQGYQITVDMGIAETEFSKVPTVMPDLGLGQNHLEVLGRRFMLEVLKVGVPHTVVDLGQIELTLEEQIAYGKALEVHGAFPQRTNVNFVKMLGENRLRVDTWERGAGLTLACGTGVCASAYTFYRLGKVKMPVTVEVAGGKLTIDLRADHIWMTGPAVLIAEGNFKAY